VALSSTRQEDFRVNDRRRTSSGGLVLGKDLAKTALGMHVHARFFGVDPPLQAAAFPSRA
jgi:hypothetical protein